MSIKYVKKWYTARRKRSFVTKAKEELVITIIALLAIRIWTRICECDSQEKHIL
jgi:hypothetical protein